MIAKKCDRCGAYYETYNVEHNQKKTSGMMFLNVDERRCYYDNPVIDLCPECMEAVRKFIEQAEKDKH